MIDKNEYMWYCNKCSSLIFDSEELMCKSCGITMSNVGFIETTKDVSYKGQDHSEALSEEND